ncbi:MAG: hypothetical protein ACO3NK_14060 [Prochlorotrichaceae cyanobacterium]|jgi:hypothetical protein
MDSPIPTTPQEIFSLRNVPADPETLVKAIAGVVNVARDQGQTLEDLTAEVLSDDNLLDLQQRTRLKDWVVTVWQAFPDIP